MYLVCVCVCLFKRSSQKQSNPFWVMTSNSRHTSSCVQPFWMRKPQRNQYYDEVYHLKSHAPFALSARTWLPFCLSVASDGCLPMGSKYVGKCSFFSQPHIHTTAIIASFHFLSILTLPLSPSESSHVVATKSTRTMMMMMMRMPISGAVTTFIHGHLGRQTVGSLKPCRLSIRRQLGYFSLPIHDGAPLP